MFRTFFLLLIAITLTACGGDRDQNASSNSETPDHPLHAAWLGEGSFHGESGEVAIKAQLELLKDQKYRFLILEPQVMMLAGMDEGTWKLEEQVVQLKPDESAEEESGGVFSKVPMTFRPLQLQAASDQSSLLIEDDQVSMKFEKNEVVTKKLLESGDI